MIILLITLNQFRRIHALNINKTKWIELFCYSHSVCHLNFFSCSSLEIVVVHICLALFQIFFTLATDRQKCLNAQIFHTSNTYQLLLFFQLLSLFISISILSTSWHFNSTKVICLLPRWLQTTILNCYTL